jgi:hypothetical protein
VCLSLRALLQVASPATATAADLPPDSVGLVCFRYTEPAERFGGAVPDFPAMRALNRTAKGRSWWGRHVPRRVAIDFAKQYVDYFDAHHLRTALRWGLRCFYVVALDPEEARARMRRSGPHGRRVRLYRNRLAKVMYSLEARKVAVLDYPGRMRHPVHHWVRAGATVYPHTDDAGYWVSAEGVRPYNRGILVYPPNHFENAEEDE